MNQQKTAPRRRVADRSSLRRWLPPVVLVSAAMMSGSPADAQDSAWQWQDGTGNSGASSGGPAHLRVDQDYRGIVAAEGQATIVTSPDGSDGGLEAAIFAAANYLSFAGRSGSTVLTVDQFRGGDGGPAQSTDSGEAPSTRATLSERPSNAESDPDAVRLDVQAIHNFLSIDLTSDDPSYAFISSIDQQSSGEVSATTGGETWLDGASGSGQASSTGGGGQTGQASGGMRTVAIGNFTSLRYGSGDGADGQ